MQRDDDVYLGHMDDLARKVMVRTEGLTRSAFDADENLRLALTHLLQTIGEAASRTGSQVVCRVRRMAGLLAAQGAQAGGPPSR